MAITQFHKIHIMEILKFYCGLVKFNGMDFASIHGFAWKILHAKFPIWNDAFHALVLKL